jgi:glycosyltransferase involved in cell wall biosynthesis
MQTGLRPATRPVHVLFLNSGSLGADVAVHLSLARTLDKSQVQVSAATSLGEKQGASAREAFARIPGITLLQLDLGRAAQQQNGLGRATAILNTISSVVSLARWCRRHQVDVIHVTERPRQALFGLFLARLAGCAGVIHALISFYPHDATRLANWRLSLADGVVGVSRFTAATYERLAKLPANRVFAVHNAVDGAVFRPGVTNEGRTTMRRRLGIPPDVPVIGCVARLMRWKGQASLLEAFAYVRATVPDAQLVLAGLPADQSPDGDGDYRDYLVRRVDALGLGDAVKLPGFLPQDDMPQFYAALDVLAHPSIEEPFGLAVVEAMACSRPVVAIDGGGIPEIIRNGVDGLLVAAEQPQLMASAIIGLLRNPEVARQLADAGRERVLQAFTPNRQAAAMLGVYREILDRRGGRSREQPASLSSNVRA